MSQTRTEEDLSTLVYGSEEPGCQVKNCSTAAEWGASGHGCGTLLFCDGHYQKLLADEADGRNFGHVACGLRGVNLATALGRVWRI